MPAPKRPNTEAAVAARRRIGQESMAAKLREAGWTVIPPSQPLPAKIPQSPRPPADYVPYRERRPVILPTSLDDLTGPTSGSVELPHRIDWSGQPVRNLDEPGALEAMYRTVLAEASKPDDLARFINRDALIRLWKTIWLPPKIRRLWEERFPELGDMRTAM
jgi:hypothetical protein